MLRLQRLFYDNGEPVYHLAKYFFGEYIFAYEFDS